MYHLFALETVRQIEGHSSPPIPLSTALFGDVPLRLPTKVLYTMADLEAISASKSKSVNPTSSLLHLCGNKWCMNPGHFFIGSKLFNDEQASCHKGLHNAASLDDYTGIREHYCKHEPKCWAMVYSGELDLTPGFCETGLPPDAVEVDEAEREELE